MLVQKNFYLNGLITEDYCLQIQEIVSTGKLSKLEHFETDEKVFAGF